jgi:type IV pilus assembly protein PilE
MSRVGTAVPALLAELKQMTRASSRGLTLVEVMVTVAIVAILASVALPAYTGYVTRSRVPAALDALNSVATRLEQRYQDTGNYANGSACGVTMPTVNFFTLTCALGSGGSANQSFTVTATGSGSLSGYSYTINHQGVRATPSHPKGAKTNCWTIKGGTCDS